MSCNQTLTVGDIAQVFDGPHATPKKIEAGPYFLSISSLENGKLDLSKSAHVSDEDFVKWTRRVTPEEGDILFSYETRLGEVAMMPAGVTACLGRRMGLLRPDRSKILPEYLLYAYQSPAFQETIRSKTIHGATVDRIALKELPSFPIQVPPLSEQRKIVDVLKGYDRKLMLNSETNQTLEEMAQTIFKSWFVDFDPVKAKMNGKQPEGMDAATTSLFPEKLVESELGLIPEGWEVGTLDSHTSMIIDHRGKTPKKLGSDWVEEGYPAISAKNIKSKKIVRPDTIRFIDEATYKKWMKEPLVKGDIIMTSEAPMGELYFFDGSEDFCLSQRLYGLRANSDVCSPEFLFNWLQTTKAKADMEGRASGTTALGIKQAELRKVKILTPPRELLEKYSAVASNLVDMAAKNNAQNTVLEDLRDTLLPKLLSGEIELGQAQELAEVE
ncbi:restriction endonuclease subunit S [Vibrio sp. Makdt]|uniref:restriction endonuclease subunit S n=1 Tax=Vibrio sp. Makdt TaxID=2998828 RepID=UPI0022CD5235|nr:restriction endonuclease subunit S [Vibrio sp. Makdt]MDA0155138.1 restriction endonuclease subunit S [Vibrio sp. Makdt]